MCKISEALTTFTIGNLYWWLPVAYGVVNMHSGNAAFSIGVDGTSSINLYEEKSGDWLCNTEIHRNGKRYEGDI